MTINNKDLSRRRCYICFASGQLIFNIADKMLVLSLDNPCPIVKNIDDRTFRSSNLETCIIWESGVALDGQASSLQQSPNFIPCLIVCAHRSTPTLAKRSLPVKRHFLVCCPPY